MTAGARDHRPPGTEARLGDRIKLFLAAGFGAGYSPVAPGTAGSAAAALLLLLAARTGLPALPAVAALLALAAAGTLLLGGAVERLTGRKDPGLFVLDEFAGFYLAVLPVGPRAGEWPRLGEVLVAFFLFRLFDVAKPAPARRIQRVGGGAGILLDDLVAGLYALLGVIVYRQLVANPPW